MTITTMKLAMLGMLAGLQMSAQASLLDPVEYQSGGLTWLTLAETVGMTVADFQSGVGGWNTKYRLASDSEIAALVASFGITPSSYTTKDIGQVGNFIGEVGGQYAGHSGTWFQGGDQGARGQTASAYVDIGIISGDNNPFGTPNCEANFDCEYATISYTHAVTQPLSTIGLFLVEGAAPAANVPEPASLALLGAAGLVALARRRKAD
jgi:hypothetical protein